MLLILLHLSFTSLNAVLLVLCVQIHKRIERLKRKVDSNPNSSAMLAVARNLRMEKDREAKISQQRQDLRNAVSVFLNLYYSYIHTCMLFGQSVVNKLGFSIRVLFLHVQPYSYFPCIELTR